MQNETQIAARASAAHSGRKGGRTKGSSRFTAMRGRGTYIFIVGLILAVFFSSTLTMRRASTNHASDQSIQTYLGHTYTPSTLESHVLSSATSLGYETKPGYYAEGCNLWRPEGSPLEPTVALLLQQFLRELDQYDLAVKQFILPQGPSGDIDIRDGGDVCRSLRLHPQGLQGIFQSGLSLASAGYVEPLLPPMRHPKFCQDGKYLMNMEYLVHDFEYMCQKLSATSKVVLFDLGASLSFHQDTGDQPIVSLINLYSKFGFQFDHIYAFEKTFSSPEDVYRVLPDELMASYHWINNGIVTDVDNKLNPWNILKRFKQEDLVIVKLDVDNPEVEISLVEQILNDNDLAVLIDQFYFEHHVLLEELRYYWGEGVNVNGSVSSSLRLFHKLRERGVAAHFWV